MHWPKTFNGVVAGSLAALLSSCTAIKAPKTQFITFGAPQEFFEHDTKQIRSFLNTYTEAFQRSNPDTKIVFLSYPNKQFFNEIKADTNLNLGPDLIIIDNYSAGELLTRNLTTTLPQQEYLDAIYNSRIESDAKINNNYTFAPWLIDTQLACFNKTKIETPPKTIKDLETLSATGKRFGLASNFAELIWTAGTQGAISEFSTLGSRRIAKQTYPAIKKWLQWLEGAAFYQNISFHKDAREMETKLKKNELDWITCLGGQIKELRTRMGKDLGVAALPNGATSKASPFFRIIGFSLGKNSSPTQRTMAMKFIRAAVNDIAQRKLELDDVGILATNKNVEIPPESSKTLSALHTSFNKQSKFYEKEWPGLVRYTRQYPQLGKTLEELINGSLSANEALKVITTPQTE